MDLPPYLIELDGLALRRFDGERDLPELFRVIEESLEHLRPWMPWAAEHSMAGTSRFLAKRAERWASGQEFTYAIVLDGAIVGACGLFRRGAAPENGREIGYWLHPAATGRGLVTRSVRALTELAFRFPASTTSRSSTTWPTPPAAPSRPGSASPNTSAAPPRAPPRASLRPIPARTGSGG